jgi:hypothetical protein
MMSSDENSAPVVRDAKDALDSIASQPLVQNAKDEAQHVVDKINAQPIVQDAKQQASHVANKVSDKVSEAAHKANPRDLTAGSVFDGLKQVDRTILRMNK